MTPFRYAEAAALVPLLHVKPGPTRILAVGPLAPLMAVEALRWRDTTNVFTYNAPPVPIKDSRLVATTTLIPDDVDAVLLSPDIDPDPFLKSLKKNGILQVSTYTPERVNGLRAKMKAITGSAVPYREYVPETLFFVIGSPGSIPRRVRRPPDGARRITERFLPALFSFGKDEIPLIFGKGEP